MPSILNVSAAFGALALLAGCSSLSEEGASAPQPLKPIDAKLFFSGRWFEIGRTPMNLTKNCVAGTTDYSKVGEVIVDRDACRENSPEGKEKVFSGPVTFLSPADNQFTVHYKVLGIFTVSKTYWVLDRDGDYKWFIVSDPQFKMVSFFTRDPNPSADDIASLNQRVQQLGYDPHKLEEPARFPPGQGQPRS